MPGSKHFKQLKFTIMEMTARLTGDATISTLKNDRQVVNFSVAINDRYKAKGSNEPTKIVTYVQCDYWVNPGVAQYLTKGTLVELQGRVGVNAYIGKDGEAKATLTFHVNTIKLHGKGSEKNEVPVTENAGTILEPVDDLPF
jgi:single-strand DNA-binding protein